MADPYISLNTDPQISIDTSSINNGLRSTIRNDIKDTNYTTHITNETKAYADHISSILSENPSSANQIIKFDKNSDIFYQLKCGWILANVLHRLKSGSIDLGKITRVDLDLVFGNDTSDSSFNTHCFGEDTNRMNNILNRPGSRTFFRSGSIKNTEKKKLIYEINTNLAYFLKSASLLGLKLVNIGTDDILHSNKSLVLGLLWQIVRYSVTKQSNLFKRPELLNLIEENESECDLNDKSPEEICLRWINYHLENAMKESYIDRLRNISYVPENEYEYESRESEINNVNSIFRKCFSKYGTIYNRKVSDSGRNKKNTGNNTDMTMHKYYGIDPDLDSLNKSSKYTKNDQLSYIPQIEYQNRNKPFDSIPSKCRNFTTDIKDSKIYLILLKQIAPELIHINDVIKGWTEDDLKKRAGIVLELAKRLGCNKFVTPDEIVTGDHRLNFLFSQTLMNNFLGIKSKEEIWKSIGKKIMELNGKLEKLTEKIMKMNINENIKTKTNMERNITNENKDKISLEDIDEEIEKRADIKKCEYECAIKDLKASLSGFSYKIENYVEECTGISINKSERVDPKDRLWNIISKLITEIKMLQVEKNEMENEIKRRCRIDKMYDKKILEYISIMKRKEKEKEK